MALRPIRLRRALSALSTLHRSLSIITPAPISPLVPLQTAHPPSSTSPSFSFLQSRTFVTSRSLLMAAGKREYKLYKEGDEITEDTVLFEGCDFNHWLITMNFPNPKPSPEEMVAVYEQTCAKGLNISIEEAKKRMYACSTTTYDGFQAVMTEKESEKFSDLPGVVFVLPDSYIDPVNKEYGGDKYENGVITHRPPPVHYQQGRRGGDRNRERNRNYEPRYDRQGGPMQNQQGSPQYGQQGGPQYGQQGSPQYGQQGGPQYGQEGSPQYGQQGGPQYGQQGGPQYGQQGGLQYGQQGGPQYGQQRSTQGGLQYGQQGGPQYGQQRSTQGGLPGQQQQHGPPGQDERIPVANRGHTPRGRDGYSNRTNTGPTYQGNYNQGQPGNQGYVNQGEPGQGHYNQDQQQHHGYFNEGQQGNPGNYNRGQQENHTPQHQRGAEQGDWGFNGPRQREPWGDNRNHMANQPGSHGQADNAGYREGHPSQAQSFSQMDQRSVQG